MCDKAASEASRRHGVPLDVLRAVTRSETGRPGEGGLVPWPWTVNMEGQGLWFDNRADALAYVSRHFDRGARSFDVGCFQINYRWHGDAFASFDDMFDPRRNAMYAAEFLSRLHAEFGNWSDAAGAYHSRTPEHAARYASRFDHIRATLAKSTVPAGPERTPAARQRADGPLIGGGTVALGSLVPLGKRTGPAVALVNLEGN